MTVQRGKGWKQPGWLKVGHHEVVGGGTKPMPAWWPLVLETIAGAIKE